MVHWPDNPPVRIRAFFHMDRGDPGTVSEMSLGVHTGTHMDAPVHFYKRGVGMDRLPFEAVLGPARVLTIKDKESIKEKELRSHRIREGERILFKTRNSFRCWRTDSFLEDFVYISPEGARYLADRGVQTVGVDYLSVGGMHNGPEIHQILLRGKIWIIEGLNLSRVAPGDYELICLPLKIIDTDGAPARAILRPLKS